MAVFSAEQSLDFVISLCGGAGKGGLGDPCSLPTEVALPFRRQQRQPAFGVGGGGCKTGLEEAVRLGRLSVLAGSALPSLLTVNQPIRGLALSGEPGLPWRWVRPGAHRSGWPDLFLTVEACVNIDSLISTSEVFLKRGWYLGAQKRLVSVNVPPRYSVSC